MVNGSIAALDWALAARPRGGVGPSGDRGTVVTPDEVLIVNGSDDQIVPEFLARDLFAAAHDPKEFLLVSGAGHGGFDEVPGSTYLDRVASFFEGGLLGGHR